jgi:hypothetical protein
MMTNLSITTFISAFLLVTATKSNDEPNTLSCYATLAPQNEIICPQDRTNFCVKEFVNSSRRECGAAEYPYDVWDVKEPGGLCVYRKCATSCPNETINFEGRDGLINSRSSVCCKTNLCNSGYSHHMNIVAGLVQIGTVALLLIML